MEKNRYASFQSQQRQEKSTHRAIVLDPVVDAQHDTAFAFAEEHSPMSVTGVSVSLCFQLLGCARSCACDRDLKAYGLEGVS